MILLKTSLLFDKTVIVRVDFVLSVLKKQKERQLDIRHGHVCKSVFFTPIV